MQKYSLNRYSGSNTPKEITSFGNNNEIDEMTKETVRNDT